MVKLQPAGGWSRAPGWSPDPGPGYFGHAEVRGYFTAAAAPGARVRVDVNRIEITPSGNVFAEGRLSTSVDGATETLPAWFLYRFRDDLLSAVETYLDREHARKRALHSGHHDSDGDLT